MNSIVRRNPSYARANLRKKDAAELVTQNADAQLTLPDGSVVTKLKDVERVVQGIIGLSREQFSQVCMISQGDFRRLLEADTENAKNLYGYFQNRAVRRSAKPPERGICRARWADGRGKTQHREVYRRYGLRGRFGFLYGRAEGES